MGYTLAPAFSCTLTLKDNNKLTRYKRHFSSTQVIREVPQLCSGSAQCLKHHLFLPPSGSHSSLRLNSLLNLSVQVLSSTDTCLRFRSPFCRASQQSITHCQGSIPALPLASSHLLSKLLPLGCGGPGAVPPLAATPWPFLLHG